MRRLALVFAFLSVPAFAPPPNLWGMDFFEGVGTAVKPVPMILEGRGPTHSAFFVFGTGVEVVAPAQAVQGWRLLRELGLPIHGVWIEQQHIRHAPQDLVPLIELAHGAGMHTMVRIPAATVDHIQGYIDTGVKGIVIPVVENAAQIRVTLEHSYFKARRQAGFAPDLKFLQDLSAERQAGIDAEKVVAFMIESVDGVERIETLVAEAAKVCDEYGLDGRHVVFWLGPYDGRLDKFRHAGRKLSDDDLLKWWQGALPAVAKAVADRGFRLGGHMADLVLGRDLRAAHGLRIFTVAGAGDALTNPRLKTAGQIFYNAEDGPRLDFLRPAEMTDAEVVLLEEQLQCGQRFLDRERLRRTPKP